MSEAQLAPVNFAMSVNVPESRLVENIRASRERVLPFVTLAPVRDRPIAIVGSGPSVLAQIERLRHFPGDIMALNGAYPLLLAHGIEPKYAVCLDAKPANINFFTRMSNTTYHLLASQCDDSVFNHVIDNGARCATFHLHGGAVRSVYEEKEVTEITAFQTVGLTSIPLAATLGYRKISLFGYDSSYAGDDSHARHQPQNDGQNTVDIEFKGKWYKSTPAMASQVSNFLLVNKLLHAQFPETELDVIGTGLLSDFVAAAPTETSREAEVAKYSDLYKWHEYGMTPHRAAEIEKILPYNPYCRTLVDVGTGRGETMAIAKTKGYEIVMGTETVKELLNDDVVEAVLPKLPFPDKSFDVLTCFEVLEHLYPFDVVPSIREMARVARRCLILSACTNSHIVGGVELHPSAMSYNDWIAKLEEACPGARITHLTDMSIMEGVSPCWQIDL